MVPRFDAELVADRPRSKPALEELAHLLEDQALYLLDIVRRTVGRRIGQVEQRARIFRRAEHGVYVSQQGGYTRRLGFCVPADSRIERLGIDWDAYEDLTPRLYVWFISPAAPPARADRRIRDGFRQSESEEVILRRPRNTARGEIPRSQIWVKDYPRLVLEALTSADEPGDELVRTVSDALRSAAMHAAAAMNSTGAQ